MHRELFGSSHDGNFYEYYAGIKDRLIKDDGNNYGYHFSPEDFYVYLTAHEYKHYSAGGTGLRSLLDIYVFLKKFNERLDFDYIFNEAEKIRRRNAGKNKIFACENFSRARKNKNDISFPE